MVVENLFDLIMKIVPYARKKSFFCVGSSKLLVKPSQNIDVHLSFLFTANERRQSSGANIGITYLVEHSDSGSASIFCWNIHEVEVYCTNLAVYIYWFHAANEEVVKEEPLSSGVFFSIT